jgi:hypothetical protein
VDILSGAVSSVSDDLRNRSSSQDEQTTDITGKAGEKFPLKDVTHVLLPNDATYLLSHHK